jgi:hypothetical protein
MLLLLSLLSSAQNFSMRDSASVAHAQNHISNLKKGIVLVRLHTQENKIKHFLKYDNRKAAMNVQREQTEKNKQLFLAFNSFFDFTDVYFFYSHHSDKVKERNFNAGYFLNDRMEEDPTVKLKDTSNVYVIDVGDVFFDSFGTHMKGMVMMTTNFKPLEKPFPYYVRRRSGLKILERTDAELVEKFNEELHQYYNAR